MPVATPASAFIRVAAGGALRLIIVGTRNSIDLCLAVGSRRLAVGLDDGLDVGDLSVCG